MISLLLSPTTARTLVVGPLLLGLLLWSAPAGGQELQTLRDEVRFDDPDPPRSSNTGGGDHHDHDDDHDHYDDDTCCDDGSLDLYLGAGYLAGLGITSPYWYPYMAVQDSAAKTGYFPAHPYQYDVGYMLIEPSNEQYTVPPERHVWAVRARGEYGVGFTGLDWVGGNLVVETVTRVGFESDFRFYQEDVSNLFQQQTESAWVGDVNLVYRFAQNEYWQFRSGLGVNFLSDRDQSDLGFNFTYGLDFYPVRPWVISSEIDWGLLGDETLIHFRLSTGVQWHGLEVFVAYDLYDVGKFDNASLVTGLRVWF
jgi:hypothetical protein